MKLKSIYLFEQLRGIGMNEVTEKFIEVKEAVSTKVEICAKAISDDSRNLRTIQRLVICDFVGSILAEIGRDETLKMLDELKAGVEAVYKQSLN
ncbi:hypothetical protein A7N09_18460 [Acinetobacter baumannii]|nr:hypothetical protein A7N09_18460 [Acinetobacter baumannii]